MPDTLTALLPWASFALNLLLIPGIRMLMTVTRQLTALSTTQVHHEKRLDKIDSNMAELRDDVHRVAFGKAYS